MGRIHRAPTFARYDVLSVSEWVPRTMGTVDEGGRHEMRWRIHQKLNPIRTKPRPQKMASS
jgi:hypothetical protein